MFLETISGDVNVQKLSEKLFYTKFIFLVCLPLDLSFLFFFFIYPSTSQMLAFVLSMYRHVRIWGERSFYWITNMNLKKFFATLVLDSINYSCAKFTNSPFLSFTFFIVFTILFFFTLKQSKNLFKNITILRNFPKFILKHFVKTIFTEL